MDKERIEKIKEFEKHKEDLRIKFAMIEAILNRMERDEKNKEWLWKIVN